MPSSPIFILWLYRFYEFVRRFISFFNIKIRQGIKRYSLKVGKKLYLLRISKNSLSITNFKKYSLLFSYNISLLQLIMNCDWCGVINAWRTKFSGSALSINP